MLINHTDKTFLLHSRVGEVLFYKDSYFCRVSDGVKLTWFIYISPYYVILACIVSVLLQAISSLQKCSINWNGGSNTPARPKAKVGPLPTLGLDTRLYQIQKLLIKTLFALCLIKWRFFWWGSFHNIVIVSVVQLVTFWTTSCVSRLLKIIKMYQITNTLVSIWLKMDSLGFRLHCIQHKRC